MTNQNVVHPVQLLRDRKGIYGIGVAEEFKRLDFPSPEIVLRPDLLAYESKWLPSAALQMMPARRHKIFEYCAEEELREVIHQEMLRRAGLLINDRHVEKPDGTWGNFWATDHAQEAVNRRLYHGLRRASLRVINKLIAEAISEAADSVAVKQARRFPFCYRYDIYRAGATSARFLQLTSVFPVLAAAIAGASPNWARLEAEHLVEIGAPLKKIAEFAGIPMALRKVKPGATRLAIRALEIFANDPNLIHAYMPQALPGMRPWLRAVTLANAISPGLNYANFIAKNFFELAPTYDERIAWVHDTADWVRACTPPTNPRIVRHGDQSVTRRFRPDMSIKTVTALSAEWHEAVASVTTGFSYEFPEPWAPAGTIGPYEILPVTNSTELHREGHVMHHCVGSYDARVAAGDCYIFSPRKDGERVATVELIQSEGRVAVGQIRGPCNRVVSEEIKLAAQEWLRSQKVFRLPERSSRRSMVVPVDNPAPEQIIRLPEQQANAPVMLPRFADANELYDPLLCCDDPDLVADDVIDCTIDTTLDDFFSVEDSEYDDDAGY